MNTTNCAFDMKFERNYKIIMDKYNYKKMNVLYYCNLSNLNRFCYRSTNFY